MYFITLHSFSVVFPWCVVDVVVLLCVIQTRPQAAPIWKPS